MKIIKRIKRVKKIEIRIYTYFEEGRVKGYKKDLKGGYGITELRHQEGTGCNRQQCKHFFKHSLYQQTDCGQEKLPPSNQQDACTSQVRSSQCFLENGNARRMPSIVASCDDKITRTRQNSLSVVRSLS